MSIEFSDWFVDTQDWFLPMQQLVGDPYTIWFGNLTPLPSSNSEPLDFNITAVDFDITEDKEKRSIDIIVDQARCTREEARAAFKSQGNDMINAILLLMMG